MKLRVLFFTPYEPSLTALTKKAHFFVIAISTDMPHGEIMGLIMG